MLKLVLSENFYVYNLGKVGGGRMIIFLNQICEASSSKFCDRYKNFPGFIMPIMKKPGGK